MTAGEDWSAPFLDPAGPVAIRRIEQMASMSRAELDALPLGVIQIDREGTILEYNAAEAELAGRDPHEMRGKNFFTEVAPCTNVREFAGRFRTELGGGRPPILFPFDFEFPGGRVHVTILMHFDPKTERGWILVQANA